MKKTISIIFISVFILLCLAPTVGLLLGYKNENAEKSVDLELPSFILDGKINLNFTKEFDDYFTKNFAFRNNLITLYAKLNSAIFKKSVSDKVIVGKYDWLYYSPTLPDYQRTDTLSDDEIYKIYEMLKVQQDYLAGKGIKLVFVVAPNKASIYGEYMPERYMVADNQSNTEKLFALLDEKDFPYVNLFDDLRDSDVYTYHMLDTHWNNYGAMIVYRDIMESIYPVYSSFYWDRYLDVPYEIDYTWTGDLSQMLYPSSDIKDLQYTYDIEKRYTSARPIRSMEDMTIQTSCEYGIHNIYMLRDSFANALIPLLSNQFSNATYSRATPYDYTKMPKDTNVVIIEIVERNLSDLLEMQPIFD